MEWDIIKKFSQDDAPCFSFEEVKNAFNDVNPSYLSQVLSKLVSKKLLIKLTRGLYYIVPLEQNEEKFIPNWHLVAKCLMRGKNYYIGYFTALQIHQLITQPSLTEIIVTDTQVKPGEIDKIAVVQSVRATQIQKDYIISWILWGISQNDFLKSTKISFLLPSIQSNPIRISF